MTADRREGPRAERIDARSERAKPTRLTALAHGMSLTIAHGDMTAREVTPEWRADIARIVALRNDDAPMPIAID